MERGYPVDCRFAGKRGRYTTVTYIVNDVSADGTLLAPGDANRVAIYAVGKFALGAAGDSTVLGPIVRGSVVPVLAPNIDSPCDRVSLAEIGDVIFGPFYRFNVGGGGVISLFGVLWFPEGGV